LQLGQLALPAGAVGKLVIGEAGAGDDVGTHLSVRLRPGP
jgi:hypothetical protein